MSIREDYNEEYEAGRQACRDGKSVQNDCPDYYGPISTHHPDVLAKTVLTDAERAAGMMKGQRANSLIVAINKTAAWKCGFYDKYVEPTAEEAMYAHWWLSRRVSLIP